MFPLILLEFFTSRDCNFWLPIYCWLQDSRFVYQPSFNFTCMNHEFPTTPRSREWGGGAEISLSALGEITSMWKIQHTTYQLIFHILKHKYNTDLLVESSKSTMSTKDCMYVLCQLVKGCCHAWLRSGCHSWTWQAFISRIIFSQSSFDDYGRTAHKQLKPMIVGL